MEITPVDSKNLALVQTVLIQESSFLRNQG
jgi:hypothetical protein